MKLEVASMRYRATIMKRKTRKRKQMCIVRYKVTLSDIKLHFQIKFQLHKVAIVRYIHKITGNKFTISHHILRYKVAFIVTVTICRVEIMRYIQ